MVIVRRLGAMSAAAASPGRVERLPSIVPAISAIGVAAVVAALVAATPIGSGDYGQWLMVSRGVSGGTTPDYRALSDVPPLVPILIATLQGAVGSPVGALHAVGFVIVLGLGLGFFAAGTALHGRPIGGLLSSVLGLLATNVFLDLLAFGGLLQATAIVLLLLTVAAFMLALRRRATERRWWLVGCAALFATCLAHVPTATVAMPVCLAAAGISALPERGEPIRQRLRTIVPLAAALGLIGAYWLLVIAPASLGYVVNPASLAYRGPERALQLLADYPPTIVIALVGLIGVAAWAIRLVAARRLPGRRDRWLVLVAWLGAAWAAFGVSALTGASTDYPRFVPLLVGPLVVSAAATLAAAGAALARRQPRTFTLERGLGAIGLSVALVAPFSIAGYQTEAVGYELPDDASLAAVASWADAHLVKDSAILAPVREAKWVEGLTGRSSLFSSQVRYAFRPVEWERSLAADALMRGNLSLANESFVLTLTDGIPSAGGQEPRSLVIAPNHGGENVDLLRVVPAASLIIDPSGRILASLPSLQPAGLDRSSGPDRLVATTRWTGTRQGGALAYSQRLDLAAGAASFSLTVGVETAAPVGGLRLELRPPAGVTIVASSGSGERADISFARIGRSEPRLRLRVPGGSVTLTTSGGLAIGAPGRSLSLEVTDLTAGGASTSLRLLDPAALIAQYNVGAVILRHDPSYDGRRARLELLGFHVADAGGPYVVMIRSAAVKRGPA